MTTSTSGSNIANLLREARAALGPEFYDLAGRIDDALPSTRSGEPVLGSLRDRVDEPIPYMLSESAYRILRAMDT